MMDHPGSHVTLRSMSYERRNPVEWFKSASCSFPAFAAETCKSQMFRVKSNNVFSIFSTVFTQTHNTEKQRERERDKFT